MQVNHITLEGNLTRSPELRYTPQGTAVADFRLASNGKDDRVTYIDVTVWGRQAETCCQHLTRGRAVLVMGRLEQQDWTGKDGEPRSKMVIMANFVRFLGTGAAAAAATAPDEPPTNAETSDIEF